MINFHDVMLALQRESITMGQVRKLFDAITRKYPTMNFYISPTSNILHSPLFESGLVKLEGGKELTADEEKAVACLVVWCFFFRVDWLGERRT